MERAKLELMVGIFVLVGIACLGYLSIKLGKLEVIGGHNYPVEAEFTSASGLKPGASVEIAGVVSQESSKLPAALPKTNDNRRMVFPSSRLL